MRAIYAFGPGLDQPQPEPYSNAEIMRRHRQRLKNPAGLVAMQVQLMLGKLPLPAAPKKRPARPSEYSDGLALHGN